jgi:thymidylate synthase ThyX
MMRSYDCDERANAKAHESSRRKEGKFNLLERESGKERDFFNFGIEIYTGVCVASVVRHRFGSINHSMISKRVCAMISHSSFFVRLLSNRFLPFETFADKNQF